MLDTFTLHLEGDLKTDYLYRTLYSTDASAYQEKPIGIAFPKTEKDLVKLVNFANKNGIGLIARTAGTSLAGQVVGNGLVIDMSRYMTKILKIDTVNRTVTVQPGVIRNDLNTFLKPYNLYFAPETSTANRAMIGGMVGNNSCGSNSIVYGSTRDHLLSVKAILADGSMTTFNAINKQTFFKKMQLKNLEGHVYRNIHTLLSDENNQKNIIDNFPKPNIDRRNTGYALDLLLDNEIINSKSKKPFNFCKLIAGSEGTLALLSEITLNLSLLPPPYQILVCAHFESIDESLKANLIALQFDPHACELIDHYVIECTKTNIEQKRNTFFIQGEPKAVLIVNLRAEDEETLKKQVDKLIQAFKNSNLGYHFSIVEQADISKVWDLRKAGLGLLANIPGNAKPVPVIEDTCVDVNDLPAYITEFNQILKKYNLFCVHYAHAGSGELHLRPLINLKTAEGHQLFKIIAQEIAILVKKYRGSLSGEHGDGRLRGEFIAFMIGKKNYNLLKGVKNAWDKKNIFNPNKIIDTPAMNTGLRYAANQHISKFDTIFNFSKMGGILEEAEMCNGSGDCRKTEITGGIMCPSYMVTRDEKDTTRARANMLRSVLTNDKSSNPFDSKYLREVMNLCLSCKGCKVECPSNVDIAKMKAEFLYQSYKTRTISPRAWLIANFTLMSALAVEMPRLYNFVFQHNFLAGFFKKLIGFASKRSMPPIYKMTLRRWYQKNYTNLKLEKPIRKVFLFCDEFTNYNDVDIGIKAIKLLVSLGYDVIIPRHVESSRSYLSKGLLGKAKHLIHQNINLLAPLISKETPLIGLEPSTLLTFRDEALDLVENSLKKQAKNLAKNSLLLEEFLAQASDNQEISKDNFTIEKRQLKVHVHCYQKALTSLTPIKKTLTLPQNYSLQFIRSGCCGMAGSFGYEKENYEISMKIANLVLLPSIEKTPKDTLIIANGTSCRHQIKDGLKRQSYHVAEILFEALDKI